MYTVQECFCFLNIANQSYLKKYSYSYNACERFMCIVRMVILYDHSRKENTMSAIKVLGFCFDVDASPFFGYDPESEFCMCRSNISIRLYRSDEIMRILNNREEYAHIEFKEGEIFRRKNLICFCVNGMREEVEFIPSYGGIKEVFLAEYNHRLNIEQTLCLLEEEIRSYADNADNADERIENLKFEHYYYEWGGEWFIPVMKKEVNRVKIEAQMSARAEYKEERRLMGCR